MGQGDVPGEQGPGTEPAGGLGPAGHQPPSLPLPWCSQGASHSSSGALSAGNTPLPSPI